MTTRVLIADDHPTFRRGLGALLDSLTDVEVVGEAADGESAVALAGELLPDAIVMDLNMPVLNGVEATRRIVAANPSVAVLVLTMLDEDESVFAAMRAGARGYVVKGADTEDVLRAGIGRPRRRGIRPRGREPGAVLSHPPPVVPGPDAVSRAVRPRT